MYLYKMLLLAIQPMTIPSLMPETNLFHPSTQAFSLSSNETVVTNLPSTTVDFVGTTVEMMEPVDVVPSFPPTTFDAIQFAKYFAKSFAAEVKSAASVAAKDFCIEMMSFQFNLFGESTHAFIHEFVADAMIASAPFRLATEELLDELYVSVEESSDKFRAVAQDLSEAINLKYEQVYEDFETFVEELPSFAAQSISDMQSRVGDTLHMISEECQMVYNEMNAVEFVISDALPAVSALYNRAYTKLESLVFFPEPEPAPTSLESIAREALDRIFLEFQRVVVHHETLVTLYHELFAPATPPPPPSFWDQPITTTYERLEVIVKDFFAPPPPPPPRTFESIARDGWKIFSVYCEEAYEKLEGYFTRFFFFFSPPTPPAPPSPRSVPSVTIMELFHFILLEYQRTCNDDKMESLNGAKFGDETWTAKYLYDIVLDVWAPFIPNWYYLQYLLDEHRQERDSLFCFIVSMEFELPKLGGDFLCLNDLSFAIMMGWKSNERLADGRPSELFQPKTLNCP